jgi:hypothetical protein
MASDYLPTDGKAHAGPFIFTPAMQPLEGGENPFEVLRIEADTVILDNDPAS